MPKPLVNELDRYLGARMRKLRQQQGISAAVLAEAVGSTQQQISRYENGENKLGAAQLFRISLCLGTPVSWFFQGANDIEPVPVIRDNRGTYQVERREDVAVKDELAVLGAVWARLPEARRAALLQLIDSMLES